MENTNLDLEDFKLLNPIVESLCGKPNVGKSSYAASHPNAYIIDFLSAAVGFQKIEFFDNPGHNEGKGESFFSISKIMKPDELTKRYSYVTCYDELEKAILSALEWKTEVIRRSLKSGENPEHVWLIIDDTTRWRALSVMLWVGENFGKIRENGSRIEWPVKGEWDDINQEMNNILNELKIHFNIVLIHQTKKDYHDNEEWITITYPPGTDYTCPISKEMYVIENKNGEKERYIRIIGCSYLDNCDKINMDMIEVSYPADILKMLGVPENCIY